MNYELHTHYKQLTNVCVLICRSQCCQIRKSQVQCSPWFLIFYSVFWLSFTAVEKPRWMQILFSFLFCLWYQCRSLPFVLLLTIKGSTQLLSLKHTVKNILFSRFRIAGKTAWLGENWKKGLKKEKKTRFSTRFQEDVPRTKRRCVMIQWYDGSVV